MTTYLIRSLTEHTESQWPDLNPGTPSLGAYPKLHIKERERKWFKQMLAKKVSVLRPESAEVELEIRE